MIRLYGHKFLNIFAFINTIFTIILNLSLFFFRHPSSSLRSMKRGKPGERVRLNINSIPNSKRFHLTHRQKRIGFTKINLNNIYFTSKEGIRNFSTSSEPKPVLTYINPDTDKILILKQNKGKSGIYR